MLLRFFQVLWFIVIAWTAWWAYLMAFVFEMQPDVSLFFLLLPVLVPISLLGVLTFIVRPA